MCEKAEFFSASCKMELTAKKPSKYGEYESLPSFSFLFNHILMGTGLM